jgi:hypothetical protein
VKKNIKAKNTSQITRSRRSKRRDSGHRLRGQSKSLLFVESGRSSHRRRHLPQHRKLYTRGKPGTENPGRYTLISDLYDAGSDSNPPSQ